MFNTLTFFLKKDEAFLFYFHNFCSTKAPHTKKQRERENFRNSGSLQSRQCSSPRCLQPQDNYILTQNP